MSDTQKIRESLADYFAQVQALADSRPDIGVTSFVADARLSSAFGLSFSPVIFYGEDSLIMAHVEPTVESAIKGLAERLAEIPAPPTLAELIAIKRAELAKLEAGQ